MPNVLLDLTEVYEYTSMLTKGNNFCDFLFAFLVEEDLSKEDLL